MKVSIEKNELVIRIPLVEPKPSQSGKNLIVASTHGNVKEAAYKLSVYRTDLYDMLHKYGVDPNEFRPA